MPQSSRRILAALLLVVAGLVAVPFVSLAQPAGLQQDERLVPGERLKLGVVGGMLPGEDLWLIRRVGPDGTLHLPTDVRVVVTGMTRGDVERTLAGQFGAQLVVISRLDRQDDHGLGRMAENPASLDPTLSNLALAEPIAGDLTLNDAIARLATASKLNLLPNWTAMELEGVDRKTLITLDLPAGMLVGRALSLILEQASGGFAELDFAVEGQVVHVSTLDQLSRHSRTEFYDIRHMLAHAEAAEDPAWEREAIIEMLITLIRDIVRPETWRDNGGTIGSISEAKGLLVITTTDPIHVEIEQFLARLDAMNWP